MRWIEPVVSPPLVELSDPDQRRAIEEGMWRTNEAARRGFRTRAHGSFVRGYVDRESTRPKEIGAAGAELAVARFLRRAWTGARHAGPGDVDGRVEVRWRQPDTRYENPALWLNPEDARRSGTWYWILVTGPFPRYALEGYVEAPLDLDLHPEWLGHRVSRGEASWLIPPFELRRIEDLREVLDGP